MKKKTFAWMIILGLLVTLASCKPAAPGGESAAQSQGGLFDEPVTISIMMPSAGNWPYNEAWAAWKYVREATGVHLDMRLVPSDYQTKIAVTFASPESVPDMMVFDYKPFADEYSSQGAILALEDFEEQMPNWKKFWSSVDTGEREQLFEVRRSADGRTYWPSQYGSAGIFGLRTWAYRKDIFEKHALQAPTTYEELYDVAKKLKELYPESYPIGAEQFFQQVGQSVGPQWKPYFEWWEYYDFDHDTWKFGATEDTMLDMVKTFRKFYEEGLMWPSFVEASAREFNEAVLNSKIFIFPHVQVRLNVLQTSIAQANPEFVLAPLVPPVADTGTGIPMMSNFTADTNGYVLCNTKDEKRIQNTVKFFDWFYSDEACELLSWGREGETYRLVDGKKKFILEPGEDIRSKYGFQTYGLQQRLDKEAVLDYYVGDVGSAEELQMIMDHIEKTYNPAKWIAFNAQEQAVRADLGTAIRSFAQEKISKYLMGQEPLSTWDSFVKNLNEMGVDQLLAVYQSAYDRMRDADVNG